MLETKRLHLRPPVLTDADNLFQLNSDPLVMRYTGDLNFRTPLDAQELILKKMIPQFEKYQMTRMMVTLHDGTFLGWCGLKYHPETDEVDLGYRFMQKYWGMGYGTESGHASLKYGFETLGLKRIIAKAMPKNTGSIKIMQKLGMTFRGHHHDPTDPHPFILFDIKKEEFK